MTGYSYLPSLDAQLARRLHRVPLGSFPTPVSCHETPAGTLFVKHDEATHPVYGGNKLRKLEYLLGAVLARGTPYVATFGGADSNHALATALHAAGLGLTPIAFLSRQPRTPTIGATLITHTRIGTRLVYAGAGAGRRAALRNTLRPLAGEASVIPTGGSSWLGAVGYIAAAAELAAQVRAGELPEPRRIVMPLGTMSTVIGLAMGLAATDLTSRVVAVRVVDPRIANASRLAKLGRIWSTRLRRLAPRLTTNGWLERIDIDEQQYGQGYARATAASENAVALASNAFGLALENTYSGKALAAALEHIGEVRGPTLYWNTYAGRLPALPATNTSATTVPAELGVYLSSGDDGAGCD